MYKALRIPVSDVPSIYRLKKTNTIQLRNSRRNSRNAGYVGNLKASEEDKSHLTWKYLCACDKKEKKGKPRDIDHQNYISNVTLRYKKYKNFIIIKDWITRAYQKIKSWFIIDSRKFRELRVPFLEEQYALLMIADNSSIPTFKDSRCFHSSTDFVAMWKRQIFLRHWSQPAKSEDKRGKHGRQIRLSQPPCFDRKRKREHRFRLPAGNYRPRICMKVEKKLFFR